MLPAPSLFDRRQMLCKLGNGFGALGLASVLAREGLLAGAESPNSTNPLAPKKPTKAPACPAVGSAPSLVMNVSADIDHAPPLPIT